MHQITVSCKEDKNSNNNNNKNMTKVHQIAVSCKQDKEKTLRHDKGASDGGVLQRGQRKLRHHNEKCIRQRCPAKRTCRRDRGKQNYTYSSREVRHAASTQTCRYLLLLLQLLLVVVVMIDR